MSRVPNPDLTHLAILAQTRTGDLKPVLLKVHAMAFAAETHHNAADVQTFETLALGLIPHVEPQVADQVRAVLAGVADVPAAVLDLLIRHATPERGAPGGSEMDEDHRSAERIRVLVDGARRRPALARELLARPDLSIFDRALLYRHADEASRDAIRDELDGRLAGRDGEQRRPLSAAERSVLLVVAEAAGFTAALAQIARHLGLPSAPDWKPHRPLDTELFALALVGLGLTTEDCVRLFLTVDPAIAHSVRSVFRLHAVVRTSSPVVAAHLVATDLGLAEAAARTSRVDDARSRESLGVTRRGAGSVRPGAATSPREPGAGESGLPGYRSRSTTNRDRI